MISVLLCSMPLDGHVRPMVAVADALVRHGMKVRFLTGRRFEEMVTATGAEFLALPADADRAEELTHGHSGAAAMNASLKEAFFDPALACFEAVLTAMASGPVDAVLHEPTFVGTFGLHGLPLRERPVTVMCGILPLGISSRDTAPFGLGVHPRLGLIGRMRNRLLRRIATSVVLRPVHRQADVTLRQLGAPPRGNRFFLDLMLRDDLLAQFTVPEFEYPRSDAPAHLHFLGPVIRSAPSHGPLPSWWSQLDGRRPVVHVSQGTFANTDFGELIHPTLRALAEKDVTVVVTTGGRPLRDLGVLPRNALVAEFIPYDALMPKTDVFVTNGGYGGLHYAMEHGTPVVVAGDTEDKVETSARVAWSGVGIDLKTGRPTAAAIDVAVHQLLGDPRFAERSARIGESIRASSGVEGLVSILEPMVRGRQLRDQPVR